MIIPASFVSPTHEHDCAACVFLGAKVDDDRENNDRAEVVDFYACPSRDGQAMELVRRFSSEPSDYGAMGADIAPRLGGDYAAALDLATKAGVS